MLMGDATDTDNVTSLYDIQSDRTRFQSVTAGEHGGYYDLVEKKFISSRTLQFLIDEVKPETGFEIKSEDSPYIKKARNRITQNLSLQQKKPVDSYSNIFLKYLSDKFLSSRQDQNILSAVLFVDIVGSTKLANTLLPDQMSSLVRIFSQEMSILISKHAGFVLKYAGDAVIAYFSDLDGYGNLFENAVRCGKTMNVVIGHAINWAFQKFGLPSITVKVGIEAGYNQIVFFGPQPDLIGAVITMATKIYSLGKPSHIAIGETLFNKLSKTTANEFVPISLDGKNWIHTSSETGKEYGVYLSQGLNS